jgi:large subunit ribosomal protein L29
MKMIELREMGDQQLDDTLRDVCSRLFRLRFQAATERLDAPSEMRKLRKDIARIKTLQRERRLAASGEQQPS